MNEAPPPDASWLHRLDIHSVHTRLILWNALALVLIFAVLGLVLRYSLQALLLSSVDRELRARIQPALEGRPLPPGPGIPPEGTTAGGTLGADRPPGRLQDGPPNGDRLLPPLAEFPRAKGFGFHPPNEMPRRPSGGSDSHDAVFRPRFLNPQGQVIDPQDVSEPWDATAFTAATQGGPVYSTIMVNNEPVRILSHRYPDSGALLGIVQAPYPLTDVYRALSGVNRVLLLLLPLALLTAGFGSAWLTDRALHPVRRITQAAERIGAQHLSRRLPVSGNDEFAELAGTFNAMLGRLEGSFAEQARLVRRLQESVEQQRRFTADASHELRTPLTAIKANASLCLSGAPSTEDYRESITEIHRAAEAMSHLVNDLLLLARSDEGQLGRHRIELPIREAAERAAASVAHKHPKAARLEINIADPALCIYANEGEIVRLLTNLLDNAARYTPADGRITIAARREHDLVRITVTDTGAGIAPEHLVHLGERFYRADASRSRPEGGTGLGLSICKSIVEAHGGTIAFQSIVGVGTMVTVLLPASGEASYGSAEE
jgi:signal transduction histidine kinase